MLNDLEQIRECLRHAEECAQKAAELPDDSRFRQDFIQLEQRWLEMARSIEFGEQLNKLQAEHQAERLAQPFFNVIGSCR